MNRYIRSFIDSTRGSFEKVNSSAIKYVPIFFYEIACLLNEIAHNFESIQYRIALYLNGIMECYK